MHLPSLRSSIRLLPGVLASLILMVPISGSAFAATVPQSRPIDSGWELRAIGSVEHAEVKEWRPVRVPGEVQTDLLRNKLIPDPFYQDNDAKLQWIGLADWEYRTTFQIDPKELAAGHVDLIFDGLDTYAEVFVNEQSVLKADNMFRSWRIAAKKFLKPGANSLRVVFVSPVTSMIPKVKALPYILPSVSTNNTGNEENVATAPYTRKAPYQYGWDWGPRYITMGIWKPVRLEIWNEARIENFHIRQIKVGKDAASLAAEFDIEADQAGTAILDVQYAELGSASAKPSKAVRQNIHLDGGANHISLPFHIANPKLWYPNGYGAQDRYTFTAFFTAGAAGKVLLGTAELKTGLRSIELRRDYDQWGRSFTFVINGVPVFAKGANVIPFDSFPSRVTPELQRKILTAARDAHMNIVRNWGGAYYESDDYYDLCDELGILVWQDFMFGGDMVPGDVPFQENVRQEVIGQIKRLRRHPSIVLWCGNNEVETGWNGWGDRLGFRQSIPPTATQRVWQDYLILFHDIIKSAVAQYGEPVPYWPSSPSSNFEVFPPEQQSGDMHYWSVWHGLLPVEEYTKQFPRFMSEFGFQSFPEMRTIRSFATPREFDIRSTTMQAHQKNHGGNERILTYMLRQYHEPKDFPSFVYLSQVLQAEAIKTGAEHLRRQRPRVMGSIYWQLNDCWPVASWSSIDYYGRWKALQYYARRFYDELLISPWRHDGKIEIYVVNDKLQPVSGQIHIRLLDFSGKVISDKTQAVEAPAASSAIYLTLDEAQFLGAADPHTSFAVFDLEIAGKRASRNLVHFGNFRDIALPASPRIESAFAKSADGYTLTLTSPVLAPNVYVSFGDVDAVTSDNYVDLLPGEAVTISLKTPVALEQLKNSYEILSITDAFAAPPPAGARTTVSK